MNTHQKISRVIGELQKLEATHWPMRQMLMRHTNAGFMVARSGMAESEKWNALEVQRRELLAALVELAKVHNVELPSFLLPPVEEVPHATG